MKELRDYTTNQVEGGSPLFPPEDWISIVSVACQSPELYGLYGQNNWSISTLQLVLLEQGYFDSISWTTIQRCLKTLDLKPHKMDYYLFCEDPDLVKKAKKICDLYLRALLKTLFLKKDFRKSRIPQERVAS